MDDRYTLKERIGFGAGGEIFRAWDHDLEREVAFKRLRRDASSRLQRRRFVAEARIPAGLEHPNIIPIHDVGQTADGDLFYVMKRVQGGTLKEMMGGERDALLHVLVEVARGMEFAHHRGVIHRDLKPSNIMVGPFGEVLILDWGLARKDEARDEPMTLDGDVMGSLGYMAAEQALGEAAKQGPATDVHALGAMLFEVLTGRPPRHAMTLVELIPKLSQLPVPPSGPLGALAVRCLAAEPRARPQDAGEFLIRLDATR